MRLPGIIPGTCGLTQSNGFLAMQAFYYSIKHIEQLLDVEFNTIFMDFCFDEIRANSILQPLFQPGGLMVVDSDGHDETFSYDHVIAVVGDNASDMSTILQGFLKLFNIPQISPSSTSPHLSNKALHPTFLRNVPNDSDQAAAMVKILKASGIEKFSLIYSTSSYGLSGSLYLKEAVQAEGNMCVSFEASISKEKSQRHENLQNILSHITDSNHKTMAYVFFGHQYDITEILDLLKISPHRSTWIELGRFFVASETWGTLPTTLADGRDKLALGSMTFSFDSSWFKWTNERGVNHFKNYVGEMTPENNKDDHIFLMFWQENFGCSVKGKYDLWHQRVCPTYCNLVSDNCPDRKWAEFDFENPNIKNVVIATYSIGYAIYDAISESDCNGICTEIFSKNSGDFLKHLRTAKIPDQVWTTANPRPARKLLPFNSVGEGLAMYSVFNVQPAGYVQVYNVREGTVTLKEGKQPKYFPRGHEAFMAQIINERCPYTEDDEAPINKLEHLDYGSKIDIITKATAFCIPNLVISVILTLLLLPVVMHYFYFVFRHGAPLQTSGKASLNLQG